MSTPRSFEARIDADGVVHLSGELDMAVVDEFTRALATLDGQRLVLDLSGLTFLDSMGIRAILRSATADGQEGVLLRNPRPNVRRVLSVAGVNEAMGVRIDPSAS